MFWSDENTVETYFTNSSLLRRDSFLGTQGKLDLIIPKINIVSEFNLIDTAVNANSGHGSMMRTLFYPLCSAISLTCCINSSHGIRNSMRMICALSFARKSYEIKVMILKIVIITIIIIKWLCGI